MRKDGDSVQEKTEANIWKVENSLFRESLALLAWLEIEFKMLFYLCLVLVVNFMCFIGRDLVRDEASRY